jgi:hypothetical protein
MADDLPIGGREEPGLEAAIRHLALAIELLDLERLAVPAAHAQAALDLCELEQSNRAAT